MPFSFRRRSLTSDALRPSKLIVGLGNPGPGFSGNRHNVGFMVVNHLAKSHGMHFDRSRGEARVAEGKIGDVPVMLARPQTYVNLSGKSVSALLRKLGLSPADVLVVHDDLDLPVGRIRIRKGGSSGGHNGIRSIIAEIGTPEFVRVKIGIGRPSRDSSLATDSDVKDYVLSDFSIDEKPLIQRAIERAAEAVECLLAHGITEAMNKYNANHLEDTGNYTAVPD